MSGLIVTPTRVDHVEPEDAQVSLLLPDATEIQKDIVSTFCHFVHFFPSRSAGDAWAVRHPGTFILSVAEAHAIARRKNQAQYGEAMASRYRASLLFITYPPLSLSLRFHSRPTFPP